MRTVMAWVAVAVLSLMNIGCSGPTPEAYLNAAADALVVVSTLPNLTAADRSYITAASSGLACSANVLAKSEATAQEALDIAACFAKLPAIPASDSIYISTAIAAVQLFVSLFAPAPTPAAVSANATVKGWSETKKAAIKTQLAAKLAPVVMRVAR